MLIPKTSLYITSKSLFLAEPSPLPELDSWVEEYIQNKRRFTFTEEDVLKPIWHEGEDIRLCEDSRFRQVILSHRVVVTQWQLAIHTVANQDLYELLLDGLWDGRDLYRCLESLDRNAEDSSFHIYCLNDERFLLSKDENGLYCLALSADIATVELTTEQRRVIDQLAVQLLTLSPSNSRKPWTTNSILEELRRCSHSSRMLDEVVPAALESWLLRQEEWVRVGIDSWLPKSKLPPVRAKHRYAVKPLFSSSEGIAMNLPELINEKVLKRDATEVTEESIEFKERQLLKSSVDWRVTLRTFHINEGTIPVPKQARSFYPHARKLAATIALPGLWFNDGNDMTVWLDRAKHQLFGPDLQDQFAFLEAGEMLEIEWTAAGFVFRTLGVDPKVAEEESRLIDLTRLSQLRSTTLESYRVSLRAILSRQSQALSFQAIYEELCKRQKHKPNRATIRTILSSSPEFVFVKPENKWALNPEVASEVAAKFLRRSATVAKQFEGDRNRTQQEPVSLSQMIAKNRQRLSDLRSIYLPERGPNASS